jgi:hypothetical protein
MSCSEVGRHEAVAWLNNVPKEGSRLFWLPTSLATAG